jgi:hypothetical protein
MREPRKIASHVGWVKPRQRRTQQNHIVRRVSLRSTHPTFELLEAPTSFYRDNLCAVATKNICFGIIQGFLKEKV